MANDRKALVVGINKYKNYPENNLNGCVNDTKTMGSYLKEFKGFGSGDIKTLIDDQATKANIMKVLQGMVKDAKDGKIKYLVFTMSSHGTQVPDMNGDEPDQVDEAFCPHDLAELNGNWDPKHVIVDDELHDLFVQLPKGAVLEGYLDTCHSGTGLKVMDLAPGRKIKYMPPPSIEAFKRAIAAEKVGKGKVSRRKTIKASHVLWSACKANQTSADAQINGKYSGAFTYYFYSDVKATDNSLKPKALLAKIRADLKANDFDQVPEYDANATTR
ncbi:MAG TPA: caspase family protein [Methanocella sp.]|nr:caspase family protein [Methanocella sp.]